jgi:putative phosphoribosyl transferase
MRFIDHHEAGELLGLKVAELRPVRPVVLAIPPAGVRIGWEIARRLRAPMDVIVTREITIPGRTGCPVGAVVDGRFYPDDSGCRRQRVTQEYANILASSEQASLARWEQSLRKNRSPIDLEGRTAILVSDAPLNLATLRAVESALRKRGTIGIIYAVPFRPLAHPALTEPSIRIVSLFRPEDGSAVMLVNAGYQQTTEDEIAELVTRSRMLPLIRGSLDGLHADSTLVPAAEVEVKAY